jgi:anti-sigma regulatory factor (Ser/Thr protein kinase)
VYAAPSIPQRPDSPAGPRAAARDQAPGHRRVIASGTGHATARIDLPALPTTPGWARRHARAVLGAWQSPGDITETAVLIVSELVTNAVTACHLTGSGLITQTLSRQPGQIVIEVRDDNPNPPVLADAGPDAETGRGLILVQALAREWSCYYTPPGTKTVCAVIEAPAAGGEPSLRPA